MSKHPISSAAHAHLARLLAALPVAATIACTDTAPVAPPVPAGVAPTAEASAAAYPGTTNTEFSSVQRQVLGDRISLYFKYTGVVTPSMTVGYGSDVLSTQVRSQAAKKQSNGYWSVTVAGLDAGTKYWYRLDNLKSTWYDSARTDRRDVIFDLDSIKVIYDGDPGINCGDVFVRTNVQEMTRGQKTHYGSYLWYEGDEYPLFTKIHQMCSGTTFKFAKNADGRKILEDYRATHMVVDFYGIDLDDCQIVGPCQQVGYSERGTFWLEIPKSGSIAFTRPTSKHSPLEFVFHGRLGVKYVPWPWS